MRTTTDRVRDYLSSLGWTVRCEDLVGLLGEDESVNGGVQYATRTVFLSAKPMTARKALLTLIHEAGHVLASARGWDTAVDRPLRLDEGRAYLYGWAVARRLGIHSLGKAEWREFNWEAFE